ncbi:MULTISPECIES: hypothetical protein [Halorubrum]|nr:MULTISPECIES: hypothetical protein [Halorubrum]TKX71717.1 hypothetical protein EXE40_07235 [Halorubrum sp. GN11GM_10-3_MGM]
MTNTTDADPEAPVPNASAQNRPDPPIVTSALEGSEELWLDRFARLLGCGYIAQRIGPSVQPSYVYAVVMVIGWTLLSASLDLFIFNNTPIYVRNPYFLLQPIVLLGGVYAAHSLTQSYQHAISEMRISQRTSDPDQFTNLTPPWLPWALFGLAASLQLIRTIADFADFTTTGVIANGVIFPFVYAPIIVQFCVVYVSIEFIAPWRLYSSDVGIHFLDPHGVGGLRPLGELVKKAYYFVVAGLIAYALITYAPSIAGWEISPTAGAIFTGVWIATILTVAFAVFVLHRFLHREKRKELQRLEAELRNYIENPWNVRQYTIPEDTADQVEDIRQRINAVSGTREFPATFSIWTQLLLSIVIPKALQLFLANT